MIPLGVRKADGYLFTYSSQLLYLFSPRNSFSRLSLSLLPLCIYRFSQTEKTRGRGGSFGGEFWGGVLGGGGEGATSLGVFFYNLTVIRTRVSKEDDRFKTQL